MVKHKTGIPDRGSAGFLTPGVTFLKLASSLLREERK